MCANRISKLSIITPSYNQGDYIEQTIKSVQNQNYGNVEHIIVDGGSTDTTVEILKSYDHLIWVSEKDGGQADALNKGLALSTGDVIGWINSDDYYERNIFQNVMACFDAPETQWTIGNLTNLFGEKGFFFRESPTVTYDNLIKSPDIVRQQPTFFRRDVLELAGGWNAEYFMVMDYDLWVRLAKIAPPLMVDENWAYYRNHSAQKSCHGNILKQSKEISTILRREQISWKRIARHQFVKRWYWFKGLVKERLINLNLVPGKYRTRPVRLEEK